MEKLAASLTLSILFEPMPPLTVELDTFFLAYCTCFHPSGIFRISVYASVGIIATAAIAYLSIHGYVEYVALHGGSRVPVEDESSGLTTAFLPEELLPGFSGAHRGGGTDPSLPWKARGAARAAWMALNFASGGVSAGGASTLRDVAVPDGGWLTAEKFLKLALQEIEKLNAANPETKDKTRPAYRELKMQLASLQTKLGGPRGLYEARANLMELLRTLPALEKLSPLDSARWLDLQRRLADVNFQLAATDKSGAAASRQMQALSQLEDAIVLALTGQVVPKSVASPVVVEAPIQPSSTGFSIRNLWSNTANADQAVVQPSIAALSSDDIVQALKSAGRVLAPVANRAVARMLVDDVSMSAGIRQLSRAEAVCNASLDYIRSGMNVITSKQPADQLYKTSLATQAIFLQSYLAELLAAKQTAPQLVSLKSKTDVNTRNILNEAVESGRNSLADLADLEMAPGFSKSPLQVAHTAVTVAARRAASLAHSTRAVIAEVQDKDYLSALQDYEAAHTLANMLRSSDTEYSTMHSRTLDAIRRCREKLAQ